MPSGIFWYLLYVKFGVGTWASESEATWRVHHFWGHGKPWGGPPGTFQLPGKRVHACANYLQRLVNWGRLLPMNQTREVSACTRHLWRLWGKLVAANRSMENDSPGWTPLRATVLPSERVITFIPRLASQSVTRSSTSYRFKNSVQ